MDSAQHHSNKKHNQNKKALIVKISALVCRKRYPLRGCDYRMGTSIAGPQARRTLSTQGNFAHCGERRGRCHRPASFLKKARPKTLILIHRRLIDKLRYRRIICAFYLPIKKHEKQTEKIANAGKIKIHSGR
ncbi:MAG: hypothetical protein IJL32_10975 [Oscillospiraceae bacterium]|nr:hypothetical protein [Oscillospiraceae bacterium]